MKLRSGVLLLASLVLVPAAEAAGPAITVYSHDLAFVRESRTLEVSGARDTVRVPDIPDRVDMTSLRLVPEGQARVTRLALRDATAVGQDLLHRARGQRVRVTSKGDRVTEGVLVSIEGGWLALRTDDGAVHMLAMQAVEDVRLMRPPADLAPQGGLEAVIEGARGRVDAELSYLTGGLSWTAEHRLLRSAEGKGTWSTGVTIENQSGRDYRDASLKLVAGDPRRDRPMPPQPLARGMEMAMAAGGEAKADFAEEAFSEYHLYTLDRPATLRHRESQNLAMLEPHDVTVTPRYLYRGGPGVFSQIEMVNSRAAGPGAPLPGGRVRIYERDATGALQFAGEARIAHTPVDEKLTLDVGTAFDLAAERRETVNRRISDREREIGVEIKLRNRKKSNVTILIEESLPADHEVLKSSLPPTRKDAGTLQFSVPVAAGKETVLTYLARVRY